MADETTGDSSSGVDKFKTYIRTRKGMILAVEIFLCLVILICYAASHYGGYSAVAICELIFAVVFLVVFTLRLDQQFKVISWVWSDLIRAVIGALLFLITSLISVIGGGDGARIAGGVFGLLAAVLFSYDSYISYLAIKTSKHTPTATDVNDDV
ncbi:proteolipid protein 2-like [Acipenser ruthenus]|uniref:proteolipid protein 2-like n=1 Tax=Acipenser ruthenus TaxID=7906 RepID=UPI00145B4ED1|nr:proteolipid protein 2-like [Acipenser ruthenus]